jgi:hypothetical protein
MILKTIYLMIGDEDLPTDFTYSFMKRSRSLCNFLEREVLAKVKFDSGKFNRIVVVLKSAPETDFFVNSEKIARVDISFDRAEYELQKPGQDLGLYYIRRLTEGLEACARAASIPKAELLAGMDQFVALGMRNEWIHRHRVFRKLGLEATLHCRLTQDAFSLDLSVRADGVPVVEKILLETDPDEIAFEHRFKDIGIEGESLVVTSKHGRPLWRANVTALRAKAGARH